MGRIWKSPFVRLAAYYAVLGLATLLLIRTFPQLRDLFERFQELSPVHGAVSRKDALEAAGTPGPASLGSIALGLITFLSMIGALALMIPTAWVYMVTKQERGYDQSVVQTVIVLPMTVAGTLRSEEHTSELQSLAYLVCRLLLEKKKKKVQYILIE